MGQYYKPISIDSEQFLYSHDYSNGLKLMEHSYIGNDFVGAVESLIMPNGRWYGQRIIWAGDYADPLINENGEVVTYEDDGDIREMNHYDKCSKNDYLHISPKSYVPPKRFKYLVNHTKNEFCDKTKASSVSWAENLKIHPLPLLTADGNNRGGGDYRPKGNADEALVGSWKGDVITLESKKPKGLKEIDITIFTE